MLLELQNITFSFENGKPLFNELSVLLEQGKIYALMGANGAGKTTLFNLITGYYKLKYGKIYFKEKDISKSQPYKINLAGIGRTFQDLRLIAKLSVKENILLAMKGDPSRIWYKALLPQFVYKKEIAVLKTKADTIIEEYFLASVKNSLAGEISYGQQKLLTLACCVANDAELLLLDEPLAGINPEYINRIIILLQKLKSNGKTILLIEHHTESIAQLSDAILFLSNGNISFYNNYEQLKTDPLVIEGYL